ncbi:hypothetical protein TEA_023416 [Camellia sinensis var. sinensis]|uniref:DUF668 domain-containing protein n=1 Tax=Camellia sinensis var. sinensis TaxID=542762 RepID=A0A4S4EVJ6_CAMSN|nr:hypothetical protein TEA_023416 [Camellia sinensis var. sinensis]
MLILGSNPYHHDSNGGFADIEGESKWATMMGFADGVVEKLVDIVSIIHQEILEAFGDNGLILVGKEPVNKPERLGVAGLALHYANVINQIDNITSRPTSLPPNMRDQLYLGLPNSVKVALRSRCQTVDAKEELTISQIKAEMENTLQWLVPVAANTSKAHQGFGWVGEWANTGLVSFLSLAYTVYAFIFSNIVIFNSVLVSYSNEFNKKGATQNNVIRLQTLYHADKQKTELHILELAAWLHRLISVVRQRDNGIGALPFRSPTRKGLNLSLQTHQPSSVSDSQKTYSIQMSAEDRKLLEKVMSRKRLVPGLSKSQEFGLAKKRENKVWAHSRSTGNSPSQRLERPKSSALDVMDGLGTAF